ncbi:WD repeat, SAM and U-box domain-containing protein 1 isoform X3 [Anas platyrhynchos]|uniref:WD repeat, SAM and U-box domain-containing protein 1 isoform X3 n=1 Tax=Anas platyrhynchos TaxID=8839 RepID=UPI003AF278A9
MHAAAPGNEGVWESVAGEVAGEKTRSGQTPAPTLLQCGDGGGPGHCGRPGCGAASQAARAARAQRPRREAVRRGALPGGRGEPSRRGGARAGLAGRGGARRCGPFPPSRSTAVTGGGWREGALRPGRRARASPERSPKAVGRAQDGEHGSRYFQMASCGQDNKVKIWLILFADSLGVELRYKCTLSGHSAPVLACAFSYDGQMLVSGSVDKCVIIYETNTGNILHTLSQHTRYVTTCVFAPCTALLATGSMDKTVNIWQFDSKQPCAGNTVEKESEVAVQNWSEDDVSAWLCAQGLTDLVGLFKRNNIDGKELLHLTKESLTNELKIESLGLRSKILQKIEELRMKMVSVSVAIPDEFLCPITRELMKEPVIAADGYSYEKEAMENWISNKRRSSPMTNLPLHSLMLTPNRTLKMAISRWLETQQKYGETT